MTRGVSSLVMYGITYVPCTVSRINVMFATLLCSNEVVVCGVCCNNPDLDCHAGHDLKYVYQVKPYLYLA